MLLMSRDENTERNDNDVEEEWGLKENKKEKNQ
jgi:hypothetical protein